MIGQGNALAYLALLAWPVVVIILFRKLPVERALIWSILGGYMVLPQLSAINPPLIPAFDKVSIPNLAAFAGGMLVLGHMPKLWPDSRLGRVLLVLFAFSPVLTVLTNLEPLRFGIDRIGMLEIINPGLTTRAELPGLRIYDSVSALANQVIAMLPFFMARVFLRSEAAIRELLLALVVAGLLYALPMLYEVRFSPQLHSKLYGFFQHDFVQAIRSGGFRPFVFMPHGLWVAFFAFMCAAAAAALVRLAPAAKRGKPLMLLGGMLVLVVLCRSYGPIFLTLLFVPAILLLRPRLQLTLAMLISVTVISYPILRGSGFFPAETFVQRIAALNPDRAQSLGYRFDNEQTVLAHVGAKPLFGWGGWGRSIPHDAQTGETSIVLDGQWIITIGQFGWLGYLAQFGLLTLPLVALWWQARRRGQKISPAVSALALILAANILDLLPNATLIPFTWLMAGALLGRAECLARGDEPDHGQLSAAAAPRRRIAPVLGGGGTGRPSGPRSIL